MKSKELMLEDLMQVNGEVFKVISISYFDIGISDNKKDFYHEHIDNLEPIPLTSEILEKNEFYYENNVGYVLEYYNYEIIYDMWENELRILKDREQILKIKTFDKMCVHELQHALRLCGINKEIEI